MGRMCARCTKPDPASLSVPAAEKARDRGLAEKWVLTLQNTTQQPFLSTLKNRALRERLFQASVRRGNHGGPNDTTATVARLAQLRAQHAKLLGFSDYASYVLDDQMAKTPQKRSMNSGLG